MKDNPKSTDIVLHTQEKQEHTTAKHILIEPAHERHHKPKNPITLVSIKQE
jgi:hypothetical protein